MKKDCKKKYEGFSLIEMLLTISIIGMVMLISAVTLTTLIKVSTVSSNKIRARNESEFILELVRRSVRNSDPSDVYIYDTEEVRTFDPEDGTIQNDELINIEDYYDASLGENTAGNEIHFRPYGYGDWICLAYFPSELDPERGYVLRTTAQDLTGNHESCFLDEDTPSSYLISLNSDYIDVNGFNIEYTESSDGNYVIRFDIETEPVDWYLGDGAPINRTVFRQGIVSTEGLIW